MHQSANRDNVAIWNSHHGVRFVDRARCQWKPVVAYGAQVHLLGLLGHRSHRWVYVQGNHVTLIDLRRHVKRNAREEGCQRQCRQRCGAVVVVGARGDRTARDVGDEVFVCADLEYRLLIVERGHARTRQYLDVTIGLQKAQDGRKPLLPNDKPKVPDPGAMT